MNLTLEKHEKIKFVFNCFHPDHSPGNLFGYQSSNIHIPDRTDHHCCYHNRGTYTALVQKEPYFVARITKIWARV